MSEESLREMQDRYFMKPAEMRPKVYYRLTDNWLELTVRFIAEDRGVRDLKDAMSRDILTASMRRASALPRRRSRSSAYRRFASVMGFGRVNRETNDPRQKDKDRLP